MFTFPILAVRNIIERGTIDAANSGGFRNPYYGLRPGEGKVPGLWLVGDHGVYIMSNGNPDWYDYKRRHFGGDDGIEFIAAEQLIPLFDRNFRSTYLNVLLIESQVSLSLITR